MKRNFLRRFLSGTVLIIGVSIFVNAQSQIELKNVEAQKAVIIKTAIPTSEIGNTMGMLYGQLFEYLNDLGVSPAGPPFAVYYEFDPEDSTVFAAGIPVDNIVEAADPVQFMEFPEMKVVSTLYEGAYEDMMPVYEEIGKYISDNKIETNNIVWEVYLTNPMEVSPEDNQTLIYFQVK